MPSAYHLAIANAVVCCVLALAALWLKGRAIPQWSFATGMFLMALRSGCDAWTSYAIAPEALLRSQFWAHAALALTPAAWLVFSLTHARANAAEFLVRWRFALGLAVLIPAGLLLLLRDGLILHIVREIPHGHPLVEYGPAGIVLHAFTLLVMVSVAMNLERTYRTSVGTMRWRLKYMLLGFAIFIAVQFYASSQAVLFHGIRNDIQVIQHFALLVGCLCVGRSLMRPGQFTIDLHPSHSAIFGSITLVLGGAYLLVVGVLARFAAFVGGDSAFPIRAFVVFLGLVGLTIILQSDRMRLVLRRFVSRHFQRPLFDYGTMWLQFADGLAAHTGEAELGRSAVRLIATNLTLHSVSLWLVGDRRDSLVLVASTHLDDRRGDGRALEIADGRPIIDHFETHPEPVDIEHAAMPVAQLREHHASQFATGGHRFCIPLVAQGRLVGLITLGDRVGGMPFAQHDFDLFRCIGQHITAALLNLQLIQRLARTREFEAFQTMAAFFVHDLKNAANTLSLLLQNLPEHFNDPEFRKDAITGCARTVDHINDLVEKLGTLRSGLELRASAGDLNVTVRRAAADWPRECRVALDLDLGPLPEIVHDSNQLLRVFTNLIINAREATPAGGRVRVVSELRGSSAVVTVSDTGCGMTPEFIRQGLFRPFQTTKKRGLGIGLFQSRMIVEAHGGRIDVQSTAGAGTSFDVILPVARSSPSPTAAP